MDIMLISMEEIRNTIRITYAIMVWGIVTDLSMKTQSRYSCSSEAYASLKMNIKYQQCD